MNEASCKLFQEDFLKLVSARMNRDRTDSISAYDDEVKRHPSGAKAASSPIRSTPSIDEDSLKIFDEDMEDLDAVFSGSANETMKPKDGRHETVKKND